MADYGAGIGFGQQVLQYKLIEIAYYERFLAFISEICR